MEQGRIEAKSFSSNGIMGVLSPWVVVGEIVVISMYYSIGSYLNF